MLAGRLSLTRQVAVLSLLPMIALGFILARVLQDQVVDRTLADATRSAEIIAHLGVQPRLTPRNLRQGLSTADVRALDAELGAPAVGGDLARIKVWNAAHTVIYSEDHSLIGRTLTPSDDLQDALHGTPQQAALVDPSEDSETASEVGLGELIEVYVPLRFLPREAPAGAFEIYLSYKPIAAAVARDKRTIAVLIAVGLALLWAILYRIVARASLRLRRHAKDNYRLAHFDPLTGLGNRNLFLEQLKQAARAAQDSGGAVAVLLVDLERFTAINTTLGSESADEVLRQVGVRLSEAAGEGLVARVGGDEYAVLCPRISDTEQALAQARVLQARLEIPVVLHEVELDVEASIGVAVLGVHAQDADSLLRHADLALAHARAHGSRMEVYSPDYERSDAGGLKLLGQVRRALAGDEFTLHYQPKVDLSDRRITGVEALVRWEHPELGLLPPASFIPLIEQTGLIGPLTHFVIERTLAQIVLWRRRGIAVQASVNLAARNLVDLDLPDRVAGLLLAHDVPASQLVVEVTESSAMADPARGAQVLEALRAMGVGVSIDDFGTGNASIGYLADLPATEIKIDRSFVTGMLEDQRAQAIVSSTIDLARNLGLELVAEGIETEAVLERLVALGCARGQGYLFSRPLPAEDLTLALGASFGLGGGGLASRSEAVFGRVTSPSGSTTS
jgi:diguanylate cyclase (GGDEF)-like protein